ADGTLTNIDYTDNYGAGSNETETLTLDLKAEPIQGDPGIYYVRVGSYDTNLFGPGSEYELKIYEPVGGAGGVNLLGGGSGNGFATLRVTLGPQAARDAGGAWKIDNLEGDTWHSNNETTYILPVRPSGSWRMVFRGAEGFTAPAERNLDPDANETLRIDATYAAAFSYTNPVPQLVSMSLGASGVFQFQSIAKPGNRYAIEESTNLIHWVPLGTNLVPSDGARPFSVTNDPHQPRAFYRWRLVE
ncbi:MAG: hypothetical protein IT577_22265, partial [Verrucomicrobiae bacterium]|nr:hypothetical protein [Verrucomicrobiae bacterium]